MVTEQNKVLISDLTANFANAAARWALSLIVGATSNQAVRDAPPSVNELLEQFGDPARGNITSNLALFDGPSLYGYARQNALTKLDSTGLNPRDKWYGLPRKFWNWYHRYEKLPGDPDLTKPQACALYNEWCAAGCPNGPL